MRTKQTDKLTNVIRFTKNRFNLFNFKQHSASQTTLFIGDFNNSYNNFHNEDAKLMNKF